MRFIKMIILLILVAFLLIFFLQNSEQLEATLSLKFSLLIESLTWHVESVTIGLLMIVFLLLGFIVASCIFFLDLLRRSSKLKAALKRNKELEKELSALRNLPLDDIQQGDDHITLNNA